MRTHKTSLTAAAALVAVSATGARAAVIAFIDQDISIPTTYEGVSLNLETGVSTNALAGALGADMNLVFGGAGISNDADETASSPTWQPVRAGTGNTDILLNLGIGTEVGPASVTSIGFGGSMDNFTTFTSGERGYLGFALVLEDTTIAYGWAEVTLQSDNTPGVIHSWAFDDTGAALAVAAIPEPTQTLLIALGLLASTLRRRR
jgi:hypothetical protein